MRSVAIIISHYENVNFLHAAIKQVRKHKHPEIQQKIHVVDQSSWDTYNGIKRSYYYDKKDILFSHVDPLWSGYGIDVLMRHGKVTEDYVCQLHADAFPISDSWLSLPVTLIEEKDYSFVGQLQFISKKSDTIYPPEPFFAMAQCFNVAKTSTYKTLSLAAGFTRFHNRPQSGLEWAMNDWGKWAKEDYDARGSDDDIPAFHWQDKYRADDKLGLAITGYIAPQFGRIIEDIVFHFGSANEARGVMGSMPELYRHYTKRVNEGYTDELIEEMVTLAKANQPPSMEILRRNHWDGKLKISMPPSEALNKRIEELKQLS